MYKLTKLKINDGNYSAVNAGHSEFCPNLEVFKLDLNDKQNVFVTQKFDNDITKVDVGYQVMVHSIGRFLRTSEISKILERKPNYVKFQTQTSVYKLEKH